MDLNTVWSRIDQLEKVVVSQAREIDGLKQLLNSTQATVERLYVQNNQHHSALFATICNDPSSDAISSSRPSPPVPTINWIPNDPVNLNRVQHPNTQNKRPLTYQPSSAYQMSSIVHPESAIPPDSSAIQHQETNSTCTGISSNRIISPKAVMSTLTNGSANNKNSNTYAKSKLSNGYLSASQPLTWTSDNRYSRSFDVENCDAGDDPKSLCDERRHRKQSLVENKDYASSAYLSWQNYKRRYKRAKIAARVARIMDEPEESGCDSGRELTDTSKGPSDTRTHSATHRSRCTSILSDKPIAPTHQRESIPSTKTRTEDPKKLKEYPHFYITFKKIDDKVSYEILPSNYVPFVNQTRTLTRRPDDLMAANPVPKTAILRRELVS